MKVRRSAVWWRAEQGRVSAFVVVLTLGLMALAGLGLDGGLALAAKVRATGQAESAARAGAQAVDLDTYRATSAIRLDSARARELAQKYLGEAGATGTVSVSGDTVSVEVTDTRPTQLLSLIGVAEIHAHGRGSAHPQRGVGELEP
jgi:hypothetical protein